jgi:hypothetical protein
MPTFTWSLIDIAIAVLTVLLIGSALGVNIVTGLSIPILLLALVVLVIIRGLPRA